MKPRSIVFDLFGDYVRYHGGRLRLRALTDLMGIFGYSAPTVRMTMSRMRREGWFEARRVGRETRHELNAKSLDLLNEGRERIFTRLREPWDGRWSMVIYSVPESGRPTRERLRKALSWLGFGPLAPATWICPHDRLAAVTAFAEVGPVRLDLLTMSTSGLAADRELAARCWDLAALNSDYEAFIAAYGPQLARYRRSQIEGRPAFQERMRLIHDYRKFPFRDPDLPIELLPEGWFGHEAHEVFTEAHKLLQEPAERFYLEVAGRDG
ncbi:MAG: PaaX family transcriptional regulator [Streptosporangiales bacterium]|nr:PaaX family transcriptional regulator [Streptosporangiales bacterium]